MVESTLVYEIRDLYRAEIENRCRISMLYSQLLLSQPVPNVKISCAAHDWTLPGIERLVDDLCSRLPAGYAPISPYSAHFAIDTKESTASLLELRGLLEQHKFLTMRIEQHGKGLLG